MRAVFVRLHRWVGLFIAGFLILVGLTGSLLAFWLDINHWLTPELYPGEQSGILLDAATLAERAEAIVPQAHATTVYMGYPGTVMIGMESRDGQPALDFEFLHLDPIDGHERGRVTWSGLPKTKNDIMPFVYALHMYLAMNGIGDWILGAVALGWLFDCFVAFYLTLPPPAPRSRKRFLSRWKPSWLIRLRGSSFRLNFDLHRASGLWLWGILLVYAVSSVYFTFPNLYTSAIGLFFELEQPVWARPESKQDETRAPMGWRQALATGRERMNDLAQQEGFRIDEPVALYHHAKQGLYEYRVHSTRDIDGEGGGTAVYFDSRSGEVKDIGLPTGHRSGTTITTWLVALHTAGVFGLPYRVFVCAVGVLIAMISATGVYIWWRKRAALKGKSSMSLARRQ